MHPRVTPAGNVGLTVEFGDRITPSINDRVLAFVRRLERARPAGLVEVVPAYCSATVYVDPLHVDWDRLTRTLTALARKPMPARRARGRLVRIPVVYGGEFGPDLDALAREAGLSPQTAIRLHSAREYRVYMLGFSPGFPYLGTVPKRIARPRLAEPRLLVPPGSVGIAGTQTGIYPQASPGGWRLIGRTPLRLFHPGRSRPCLLEAGDHVRFVPITPEAYARRRGEEGHDDRPEL